jgi:hypothetical protein
MLTFEIGTFSTRVRIPKNSNECATARLFRPGGSRKIEWSNRTSDAEAYATTKTLLPYVLAAVNMQEGNKTVFAVSAARRIKDNQGGLQAITRGKSRLCRLYC